MCFGKRRSAARPRSSLFHNHPSGDPTPSPDDVELTRRLVAAGVLMGIDVVDHVILATGGTAASRRRGRSGEPGSVFRLLLGYLGRHGARRPARRRSAARRAERGARQPGAWGCGTARRARSCAPASRRPSSRVHEHTHAPARAPCSRHRRTTQATCLHTAPAGDLQDRSTARRCRRQGRERAKAMFQRLGEAEAAIHQMPVEKVHLHEVGALDSIIDIVGTVFAMEWAAADRIVCSPLNVGGGMVHVGARRVSGAGAGDGQAARASTGLQRRGAEGTGHADRRADRDHLRVGVRTDAGDDGRAGRLRRRRPRRSGTPNVLRVLIGEEAAVGRRSTAIASRSSSARSTT